MIRTWTFDRIHCVWHLRWLIAAAWRALPHVSALTVVMACGGSAPPPPLVVTPPPAQTIGPPPGLTFPPPWPPGSPLEVLGGSVPGIPIPLGPVLEAAAAPRGALAPLCPTDELPTVAPVSAPGPLWWFGGALLVLGLLRTLQRRGPAVPSVRWVGRDRKWRSR